MIPTEECLGPLCGVTSSGYAALQETDVVPTSLGSRRADFARVHNDGVTHRMDLMI
jgi:hypothetical protein